MNSAAIVLLSLSTLTAQMLPPGDHVRELRVVDQIRSYLVHIPLSYQSGKPAPVVLVFHSAAMNGSMMARCSGLNPKADQSGFVVVYANGRGSTQYFLYWTRGGCGERLGRCGLRGQAARRPGHGGQRRLAAGLRHRHVNGAMMCYRLAAELSDRIAAIAPIAGTMAIEDCRPRGPSPCCTSTGPRTVSSCTADPTSGPPRT